MTIRLKNSVYLPLSSCQFVLNCPRRRRTRLKTLKTEGYATLSFQLCLELIAVHQHMWLAGDISLLIVLTVTLKENSSKRKRTNANEMKRKDESSWDFHARSQRWGYSSPAFHCRSPPAKLYKLKNPVKRENNPADHCDVPGMTVQQAILFRRALGTKFLGNNQEFLQESRKHNNTPVSLEAAPQKPLKKACVNAWFQVHTNLSRRQGKQRK